MKKKLNDKQKLMAYVLSTDADLNANKKITQSQIGDLFGVSQPTIANANKETSMKLENLRLQKELSIAKQELRQLSGIENYSLPDTISDEYRRKW